MKMLLAVLLLSITCVAQKTTDQDKVWALEHDYWGYVQAGDMKTYRTLWHENFVGWPYSSPQPARKNHITDWYDERVKHGLTMKSWELEPLEIQVTGPVVVTHYRMHAVWVDRQGKTDAQVTRVHHTWLRTGNTWQIISGMSASTNKEGK